ncbi:lymphocyte function-associated antigen 3 [Rhinichthys klamathensis goyatoka]|uniref:lymphocyte function-associated antigen 3 n=1 Tax=Rhinichthys klamathensis goyatoka TaxID=3034132 RepID=UPI0024B562DB|nr:lymphocyte function-associated antigen 3 [Rhinichthys klamathensis goyatoka]
MAVTTSLVFITCLCFAREFVFCDDYEEIGKDITLTPSIRGKPTDILWKHNENMVLLYDGREVVEYASFKHRVVVDFETGQLTIRKLTSQDSGEYQSEIVINGKVQTSSHTVTVLDVLPEPQVTCEPGETSDVKKLLCSVESRTQPSYKWSGPNIRVHPGPELLVEEQEENRDSVYTCTVKNQANSRSTDFTLADCPTGRAATAVLVPVIIIALLLLILLILLGVFLYRRKEKSRQSALKKMDLENGEGHSLMRNYQKDVMPGSSEATLPSHARLPPQNQSIMDKKWDQGNGAESSGETNEGHKPLKETNKCTLKQSPQSAVSETNHEDTESGNKGELDQNVKNSEHAVEAEENTHSDPDETEKERQKQRLEEEEKENSQKQESGNEEEFPEHQNERKTEDNREDDQTPGEKEETKDRGDTETVSQQSAVTERNSMDSENEAEQRHQYEKKSQSEEDEQSAEQPNESMRNQKTKDVDNREDDMRPGGKEERSEEKNLDGIGRTNTAEAGVRPAVDPPLDGEALSSPADSPANPEKKPMNSSDSSSNQTDPKEVVRELSGSEPDEEETVVTNQEQKAEGKTPEPEISEEQSCRQLGDGLSKQDKEVPNKSKMTDKDQSFKLIEHNAKTKEPAACLCQRTRNNTKDRPSSDLDLSTQRHTVSGGEQTGRSAVKFRQLGKITDKHWWRSEKDNTGGDNEGNDKHILQRVERMGSLCLNEMRGV